MALITVGVPVYNGESMLDECLKSLLAQTFRDFEVVVYDNASTDRTAEIVHGFVARDSRIRYVRQPFNKGATQNFLDVLNAAQSPLFMWRAYDDLSDPRFLEVTSRILVERPQTQLAVTKIRQIKSDNRQRELHVKNINNGPEALRLWRALMTSGASWFYGLWRRETLINEFETIWQLYPHGWGSDHLTLFRLLINNEISGSNESVFIQRMPGKPAGSGNEPPRQHIQTMVDLRRKYSEACQSLLSTMSLSVAQRAVIAAILPFYLDKRIYSRRKIVKLRIKETMSGSSLIW